MKENPGALLKGPENGFMLFDSLEDNLDVHFGRQPRCLAFFVNLNVIIGLQGEPKERFRGISEVSLNYGPPTPFGHNSKRGPSKKPRACMYHGAPVGFSRFSGLGLSRVRRRTRGGAGIM